MRRVFLAAGDTDTVDTLAISACARMLTATGQARGANDHHRQTRDGDGPGSCLITVPSDVSVLALGETGTARLSMPRPEEYRMPAPSTARKDSTMNETHDEDVLNEG